MELGGSRKNDGYSTDISSLISKLLLIYVIHLDSHLFPPADSPVRSNPHSLFVSTNLRELLNAADITANLESLSHFASPIIENPWSCHQYQTH